MSQASAAVRAKRKNYERHWTSARSESAHHVAFFGVPAPKSAKRLAKEERMAKLYREFFADPANQQAIRDIRFEWGIELVPRLVRDEVLGRRSQANRGGVK